MIGDRIKKLRKALDLTQQAFSERIGVKRNTIAKYETTRGEPIDAVISLICREFNVNEAWLRTGEGEMFVQKESTAIERLCADMNASELDAEVFRLYFKIDPKIRGPFVQQLFRIVEAEYGNTEPPQEMDSDGLIPRQRADVNADLDIAAELAELKRQNQEIMRQNQKMAAEIAAMKEEDALMMEAAEELSAIERERGA